MWGVILGHLITALKGGLDIGPIFIHTFVRTYDMPFFMVLSGFFLSKSLEKYSIKTVLTNRITMILFPIFIWNIISMKFNYTKYYFLWAVFFSSILCILSYAVERLVKGKKWHIELFLEIAFVIGLYFIYIPWNLFYLFPFFVFGRYMKNIKFEMHHPILFIVSFIIALCFWQGEYSPWRIGFDNWRTDSNILIIYFYRFILGLLGCYIIANVLNLLFNLNWGGQKYLIKAGSQTLGIYILQSIVVENYFNRVMRLLVSKVDLYHNDSFINLMGYVIAPILSLVILIILSIIITKIENCNFTSFLFGFKVKSVSTQFRAIK